MLLIDLIITMSVQKIVMEAEVSKANVLIASIEEHLTPLSEEAVSINPNTIERMLKTAGFDFMLILDKNLSPIYDKNLMTYSAKTELESLTKQAVYSSKKKKTFSGTAWAVFWKGYRDIIVASPLYRNSKVIAGAGVVVRLEETYMTLRKVQQIIVVYILINTLILTLIGLHRLSRIILKPVHNLLRKADDFNDTADYFYLDELKGNNEFHLLSKALNRMLLRISEDREKLRSTVRSLEKANSDLKQAQKEIVRAEKLATVGRLSAGIAHEIGNPIGIVIGYLELLKRNDLTDTEKEEFITRAGNEINRISKIIRQLLDFSRPSDESRVKVSLHDVIRDIENVFTMQPLMSKVNLRLELSASVDTVYANPNQLRQVFLNLMINASDAIAMSQKPDGTLLITTESISLPNEDHPSMVKIQFIDNGIGIPENHLNNIFDPFFTTKDPGKGTGLGLSVSFTIIDAIGGKIEAFSKEGEGTTMVIHLPVYSIGEHEQKNNNQPDKETYPCH